MLIWTNILADYDGPFVMYHLSKILPHRYLSWLKQFSLWGNFHQFLDQSLEAVLTLL